MADKTISELPAAGSLTGDELVLLEQNAEAKKASSGAFISKVAEEVAGAPGFEEQIQDAVDAWMDDHDISAPELVATLDENGVLMVEGMTLVSDYDTEVF